jgi:hypothetical protein
MTLETPADRAKGMPPDTPRIRVGNGGDKVRLLTLDSLDRRCAAHKRTTRLIEAIEADAGGADRLSTGERQIIQRAAIAGALSEHLEARWLSGGQIDPATYCTLANCQRRLLEVVYGRSLERRLRDVSDASSTHILSLIDEEPAA